MPLERQIYDYGKNLVKDCGLKKGGKGDCPVACAKKKNWNSATVFGGIVYFVNIRHYANFQIYRPINDTVHPT